MTLTGTGLFDDPRRTTMTGGVEVAPQPRDVTDPSEVGRRMHMLVDAIPALADEEESLYSLANSNLDDNTMLHNATSAISQSTFAKEATRLREEPKAVQRGSFANYSSAMQRGLEEAGYRVPTAHEDGHGLLDHAFGGVAAPLEGLLGAARGSYNYIGAPLLHTLDTIADQPSHLYRMGVDLYGNGEGGWRDIAAGLAGGAGAALFAAGAVTLGATATVATGGTALLALPVLASLIAGGPSDVVDAFLETGNGERYFTDPAKRAAREELGRVEVEGANTDTMLSYATEMAGGTKVEELLKDLQPGTQQYQQAFGTLQQMATDPSFKRAVQTLQQSKVSLGRNLAGSVGLGKNSSPYGLISGLMDGAFLVVADPTLIGGKLFKAAELSKYGVNLMENSDRLTELYNSQASVKRAFDTMAKYTTMDSNVRWATFARRYPEFVPMIELMGKNSGKLKTGEDIAKFFSEGQNFEVLLRGGLQPGRAKQVLAPRISQLTEVKAAMRSGVGRAIDIGNDAVINSRNAQVAYRKALAAGGETAEAAVKPGFNIHSVTVRGKQVNLDPFAGATQLLKSMGTHMPKQNFVTMGGPEAAGELRKMVEMGFMADVPSSVRNQWFTNIIDQGNLAGRHVAVKDVVHDMFGYLPDDPGVSDFVERFTHNLDMIYGGGSHDTIQGLNGKHAIWLNDASHAMAIADGKEFIEAGRHLSLWRAFMGKTLNRPMVDSVMGSAWKPSVLLRIGFIPRAAGEELLNFVVRSPLAYPMVQALRSAAADTPESLVNEMQGAAHLGLTFHVGDLEAEFAKAAQLPGMSRKFPNWGAFVNAIDSNETPIINTLKSHSQATNQLLHRYFDVKVRGGSQLLKPFQLVAGMTGAVARPWDEEVERIRQIALARGATAEEALAEATSKQHNIRKSWGLVNPLMRMSHNIAQLAPGGVDAGIDMVARNFMYNASQGYRRVLRSVLNPDDVAIMRLAMHDDVVKKAMLQHVGAGMSGIWADASERAQPVMLGDGTTQMARKRSTFTDRYFRDDGLGHKADALAPHALWNRVGHIMNDPIGRAMHDVSRRYVTPKMAQELSGFGVTPGMDVDARLAGQVFSQQSAEDALHRFALTFDQIDPQIRQSFLDALETGHADDLEHAVDIMRDFTRRQGEKLPSATAERAQSMTDAMWFQDTMEGFKNFSPRTRSFLHNTLSEYHAKGALPEFIFDTEDHDRQLLKAAIEALHHPDNAKQVSQMTRHLFGSVSGIPTANAVQDGYVRLYIPLVDSDLYAKAGHAVDVPPEFLGYARIGSGERETRHLVTEQAADVDQQFARMAKPHQPVAHYGTTDPDRARAMSAQWQKQIGADHNTAGTIGYIDVPANDALQPVGDVTGRIHPLHYPQNYQGTTSGNFYIEPSYLARTEAEPLHMSAQMVNGQMVWGNTVEEQYREWASVLADEYRETFMSPDGKEMLHELAHPARLDDEHPLFHPESGQRRFRSNTGDVMNVPGDDLPLKTFGNEYDLRKENGWNRFLRFGFDTVIGNGIDAIIRKPEFLHNYLNAFKEAQTAEHLILDPKLWGEYRTAVTRRTRIDITSHIPEVGHYTPVQRAELYARRGDMGAMLLDRPSPAMQEHMRGIFGDDWPGFTVPGTGYDFEHDEWLTPGTHAPQLSTNLDTQLDRVKHELEMLADNGGNGSAALQEEAAAMRDTLNDVRMVPAEGGPLEGGSKYIIDQPKITNVDLVDYNKEVDTEGSLHPLARKSARRRADIAAQDRIPVQHVPTFLEAGPGGNDPTEILRFLGENEDAIPQFKANLRAIGRADKTKRASAKYLRETIDETVAAHAKTEDPAAMIEAWRRLPERVKDPKLTWEEVQNLPETPTWVKELGANSLPILRAGDENLRYAEEHVRDIAIDRAVNDTVPFIDNHHIRSQYQEWGRNVTPFWFAEEQFLRRWARTVKYTPQAIERAQLLYQGLRSGGVVQTDDQGNDVLVYPGTPALTNVLSKTVGRVPIGRQLFGADAKLPIASLLTGDVKYATPGFDGLGVPGVSPMIGLGLNELVYHFPELAPLQEKIVGERGVGRGIIRSIVPTSIMRVYDAQANEPRIASAMLTTLQVMAANGQLPPEEATPIVREQFLDRVRNQTKLMLMTQAVVGFIAPSSPRSNIVGTDAYSINHNLGKTLKGSNLNPQLSRLLQGMGPTEGIREFLREHPDATLGDGYNDAAAWTANDNPSVSRAPLPATAAAAAFYDQHKNWLAQFPAAGGWFLPQSDHTEPFSRRAYHQQLAHELRLKKAPEQFLTDLYFASGSDTYFDQKTKYDDAYEAASGKDRVSQDKRKQLDSEWRAWKEGYFAQHPVLQQQLVSGDAREQRARVLDEMETALADPKRPMTPQAPALFSVVQSYRTYQAGVDQLWGDRSKVAEDARQALRDQFQLWIIKHIETHPETRAFIRNIIAPSVDPGMFDDVQF